MDSLKVLIVDDSAVQREYLQQLCRDAGMTQFFVAENGEVALPILAQQPIDLLICDLEMPDLDGIELLHQIAQMHSAVRVIIVSGRELNLISSVELMAKSDGLNVVGSMQKPVNATLFHDLIAHLSQQAEKKSVAKTRVELPPLDFDELREAILQHRFILHYQPKVDRHSGALAGVEALVRLQHPSRGLVYPGDFIAVCERYQLIDALSYEVLLQAIAQLEQWKKQGFSSTISVNLSATSFENNSFMVQVNKLLAQSPILPTDLIFEVTETAVIHNMGQALAFLSRLRLSGFGLSIDDYGTGYSSVKQLSQIPFTELKIDRSLVDGIANRPHLQVIFESTVLMCNKLGIHVVAEGVENSADWQYLSRFQGLIVQGYYIAKPMNSADLICWVLEGCQPIGSAQRAG